MGWKYAAASAFTRSGGARLLGRWYGSDRLTVLAYHRVIDHDTDEFLGFSGNVSASPEAFDEQMAWVASQFTPVSIADVVASLDGVELPERPLLVTFDDGYRDNHDQALPILRRHGIRAAIFLATDHIGSAVPFWWDRVAWLIHHAEVTPDRLPTIGPVEWNDPKLIVARLVDASKALSEDDKLAAIDRLAEEVDAPDPGDRFAAAHLDWDLVSDMQDVGVEFGAHTCSHPILSRVDPDERRRQIVESAAMVAQRTGRPAAAFAYPNGLEGDFGDVAVEAVSEAGMRVAFSLRPGPTRRREVEADPLRIGRIYIDRRDDLARFAAKVAGVPRLVG